MEWQQEEIMHGCVQHDLDAEVAELERCQTQFEAQCGGEAWRRSSSGRGAGLEAGLERGEAVGRRVWRGDEWRCGLCVSCRFLPGMSLC